MVYYSNQADEDIENIFIGLLSWKKHTLTFDHVWEYRNTLRQVCDSLESKPYHVDTTYSIHQQYGTKVHSYRRNKQTIWYIIYDIDYQGNIFINKIISNYLTVV
ncbi:hypothetical protein FACS189421_00700 [Bacteroidia bacterium]|nr:hypothetical protein FACS189421_00700 [Bacteroidia bacterium]GHT50964.1 hypothetical protein FACS189440_19290 [Bacteroidia bacterium]